MNAGPPVILAVRCTSCQRDVELECEGLPPYPGYKTFHEFACPHCRKQNHALTTGAILAVRPAAGARVAQASSPPGA